VTETQTTQATSHEEQSQLATDATLESLLDDVRDELQVDTAAVLLLDESEQYLVAAAARGIEEEVRQGARVRAGQGFAGRIFAERRPVILDRITPQNVVNPLLLRRGIVSMLGVPLYGGRQVLGVLHVGVLRHRDFAADDVETLERAARRISRALLRHRSYVDRTAARALQSSLIPRLPEVPDLAMAARYVPVSQYGVGGDWYDVFVLPSGLVGITIGDVMGHGLHAATMMGRVRSSLRSYALEHVCPASVLERLDRKITHFEPGLLATICYAVFDPDQGTLLVSSAGHLRPAVRSATGDARFLDVPVDPPIGIDPHRPRRVADSHLAAGELLCLYTDGVVERRTSDLDDQLETLRRTLASPDVVSAEAACAEVMDAMLGDREPDDDVSLLAVSRAGG
jgi:sigma-B regulation protein RsbU (phosphoserine phosphatase)